jgi:hypothetical protein
LTDIRLNCKSVGTFFANFGKRLLRGGFIFYIVDGDPYSLFGDLESNTSADAPRTPSNQGALG